MKFNNIIVKDLYRYWSNIFANISVKIQELYWN